MSDSWSLSTVLNYVWFYLFQVGSCKMEIAWALNAPEAKEMDFNFAKIFPSTLEDRRFKIQNFQ